MCAAHATLLGMLNPFPIQFLALFAYFILRLFLGWLLFWQGYRLLRLTPRNQPNSPPTWVLWLVGSVEILVGLQFILGFLTQIAALITTALALIVLCLPRIRLRQYLPDSSFWLLTIAVSLSLFITGSGVFAYDLPI